MSNAKHKDYFLDTLDWTRPRWIDDELVLEEARRRERAGEGTVIEDGQPPACWIPNGEKS